MATSNGDGGSRRNGPGPAFVALAALTGGAAVAEPPPGTAAQPDPKDGPPCHLCPARCCKYFALQIDAPTTPREHDQVRWFLVHEGVAVWVLEGDWYVEVRNRCRNLLPDNRCAIYETRPQICRDYGMPDGGDGPCEYFTEDGTYDLYFDSAEAFEVWSREQLERRERRLARRRERYRQRAGVPASEVTA